MGRLLFLGSGASLGVPVIGCTCSVCTSPSSFNRRFRPSVLIQTHQKQFLIDAGPDFRCQALQYKIEYLDGLILTHAHHDHTGGLDDLRPFFYKLSGPLPVLLSEETSKDIQLRFHYVFKPLFQPLGIEKNNSDSRLNLQLLPEEIEGSVIFESVPIDFVTYEQARMAVNGYRFGDLAYLSDIRHYPQSIFRKLSGVKTLIISALRSTPSLLHFSVIEAMEFAKKIDAKYVWLTHISHEMDHEKTNASLPSHVRLAYDGLEVEFNS
ncbi:MAG: MBL fold metallo-hydrolase [Candidatus Protochlamydia sp.]|nr:MBL fold metallo-hydrolase [Candidatus Protochlamydia sp.]